MRKLTLNRDLLLDLDTDDLRAVGAAGGLGPTGPLWQCLSGILRCDTADSFCEFTQAC